MTVGKVQHPTKTAPLKDPFSARVTDVRICAMIKEEMTI
eukprot:CAMPEP_0168239246 /NCGR_PEP_ID=MMETSP0140_2-20121125/21396_1 /TAXON_ID=44445 /ORGANISM="Pseudo-nitzschia australis, Strain 10249 10 AB" /LENGTH=38 /DNA_ID= /DNA_START= /DNA_END= /DNA_ORIENTATION=